MGCSHPKSSGFHVYIYIYIFFFFCEMFMLCCVCPGRGVVLRVAFLFFFSTISFCLRGEGRRAPRVRSLKRKRRRTSAVVRVAPKIERLTHMLRQRPTLNIYESSSLGEIYVSRRNNWRWVRKKYMHAKLTLWIIPWPRQYILIGHICY